MVPGTRGAHARGLTVVRTRRPAAKSLKLLYLPVEVVGERGSTLHHTLLFCIVFLRPIVLHVPRNIPKAAAVKKALLGNAAPANIVGDCPTIPPADLPPAIGADKRRPIVEPPNPRKRLG